MLRAWICVVGKELQPPPLLFPLETLGKGIKIVWDEGIIILVGHYYFLG